MRIKKLQAIMRKKKLDCVILTTQKDAEYNNNIFYYTGFKGYGILIVKPKTSTLLVPEMELVKAKRTGANCKAIIKGKKDEILKKEIGKVKTIGVDETQITLNTHNELKKIIKAKWVGIFNELFEIRSIKDKKEILKIKKACKVGDDIFYSILDNFNFKTEKELAIFIDLEIRKRGLVPSFPAIVASGKNASVVHHNNEGKIKKGFLLLDFGVKVDGYCSDMSRTIYLGKPSENEILEYEKVLSVQEDCIKLSLPEKECIEIDSYARQILGKNFNHGLGHGVGLNIHEFPNFLPESKDKLNEGNIVTIEPGIYIEEKFGIRIEDTILVGKKPICLTKATKDLVILDWE